MVKDLRSQIPQSVTIQKADYSHLDIGEISKPFNGFKKIVSKGERVLLKVNLLSASTPDSAVVTHPNLVKAVAKEVLKYGGQPVIADSPSREFTKGRLEKVYETSGLRSVAAELGVELNYDTGSKRIKIPTGKKLKSAPIANFILDSDKIIALPKIKTHSLMYLTLATKIMYGAVPGLTKAKYHSMYFTRKAFADMLLDVLSVTQPDLFIMDGIVGMQGDGPMSGDPVGLGVLMASKDAVALDIAVCNMLGVEPVGIPVLKRAKLRGLWPDLIEYPLLAPKDVYYPNFRLPSTAGYILTGRSPPKRFPVPSDNCTGCSDCEKLCPKNAIKVTNSYAVFNYDLCIRCYCCHEVCPENAIKLEALKLR
jgi:uncharacterized protein (DUF362 family)